MQGVKYFMIITRREYAEKYFEFFKMQGIEHVLNKLCVGTTSANILELLGLEKTENIMFEGMVRQDKESQLKNGLIDQMNLLVPGNGIAIFTKVDGIGGEKAKNYFLGEQPIEKKENTMTENNSNLVLIITVVDKGCNELVMEKAREAGATGGTVVKAHGTGAEIAKFFGVSITEEKEMVYIVSPKEKRDDIMYAIMEKAREINAFSFSLPLDSVVGIKNFRE